MEFKNVTIGTIFFVLCQLILVISIIGLIFTGSMGFFVITVTFSIFDLVLILFFLVINWRLTIDEIDWDNPLDW
jgi:hypothetical protein